MSWMWAVELVPLSIRGPANAMATAANWLANFIVVIATPSLFGNERWKTYVIFAVFNFVFIPTIYFFYPETGGRSLEEVDLIFSAAPERGNAWLGVVKTAQEEPRWFDRNGDPTDSYGTSSVTGEPFDPDPEKLYSTSNEVSPDSFDRNARPSTSREVADYGEAAPAPTISRTHSQRSRPRT